VLAAFAPTFKVTYRASVPLDASANTKGVVSRWR
jgi:hypothetical protein